MELSIEDAAAGGDAALVAEVLAETQPEELPDALCAAAGQGHVDALRALLADERIQIDARAGPARAPALMQAAERGHADAVDALLQAGADPNASSAVMATPLEACKTAAVARLLIAAGANLGVTSSGNTPLIAAARRGRDEVVDALLEAGADAELRDDVMGDWPLLAAAQRGSLPMVEALLRAGADPTASSEQHGSVLQAASVTAKHGAAVAQALMAAGAQPGPAELRLAASRRRLEAVDELLKAGAELEGSVHPQVRQVVEDRRLLLERAAGRLAWAMSAARLRSVYLPRHLVEGVGRFV